MIPRLGNENGSALIIVSILLMIVGIFSFNVSRQSVVTANLQKSTNIKRDRSQVERFIRVVLSNPDLCTKLVKVDRNNQVRIDKFNFRSGRVEASRFQFQNTRFLIGDLKLGTFTYDTRCPNMEPQKQACYSLGSIPLLYQQDKKGNLLKCEFGGGPKHCDSMGGVWVESAKTCDLCFGLGGYWEDGRCAFR